MARVKKVESRGRKGWEYRFTDPLTSRRTTKIFFYRDQRDADRAFREHLEGQEDRSIGIPDKAGWKITFDELVKSFLKQFPFSSEGRRVAMKRVLDRNELGIRVASDLNDTAKLTAAAQRIAASAGAHYARHSMQGFLKQLTRWAAGERILPLDPLSSWRPLPWNGHERQAQAFTPAELAAVLRACADYDEIDSHEFPTPLIFKTVLVAGNRPTAIFEAKVKDLRDGRIHLPPGNGKKRNGHATLPADLIAELEASVKRRKAEPEDRLLVSANGEPVDRMNIRRTFDRAVVLAFVKMYWPANAPEIIEPAEVAYLIYHGRVKGFAGPAPIVKEKKAAQDLRVAAVEEIEKQIGPKVQARARELYMYHLRHTHQTWAEIAGVNGASIDLQIGHSPKDTGARRYRDLKLVNARLSSQAVWDALISAMAEIERKKQPQELPIAVGAEGGVLEVVSNPVPGETQPKNTGSRSAAARTQPIEKSAFELERVKGFEPSTSTLAKQFPASECAEGTRRPTAVLIGDFSKEREVDGGPRRSTFAEDGTQSGIREPKPFTTDAPAPSDSAQPAPQKPAFPADLQARIDALVQSWPTLSDKERRALDGIIDLPPPINPNGGRDGNAN